jgi:hypothetical protein
MTLTIILIVIAALLFGQRPSRKNTPVAGGAHETTARVVNRAPEPPDYGVFVHPAFARKEGPRAEALAEALKRFHAEGRSTPNPAASALNGLRALLRAGIPPGGDYRDWVGAPLAEAEAEAELDIREFLSRQQTAEEALDQALAEEVLAANAAF